MTSPVTDAIAAITLYCAKEGNAKGGSLALILEGFNYDERSAHYCLSHAARHNDEEGVRLATQLLKLSCSQRQRAVEGFWTSPMPLPPLLP